MENTIEKKVIPSSAFDIEYRTQWRDEVDFLESRGIYYTIRKVEGEYNIPVYKYTRTAELFLALADFYLHRLPNRKSQATYTGRKTDRSYERKPRPKFEQQNFLNDNGTIKKEFENLNTAPEYKETNVVDLEKIKEAQKLLKEAEDKIGKEKLSLLTAEKKEEPSDDTE